MVKLSTRPEKRVGTDAMWDHAEDVLRKRARRRSRRSPAGASRPAINPGEGTFYGPKFEYVLRDAIGRDWQCGTTQVDFNLPERFGAFYIDADGEKKKPVMVHRAICGSMERFIGILIEHLRRPLPALARAGAGRGRDHHLGRRRLCAARCRGLRGAPACAPNVDLRNEKINYKVREHSLAKVPALLVVGKKEAEKRTVSIRRLGSEKQR